MFTKAFVERLWAEEQMKVSRQCQTTWSLTLQQTQHIKQEAIPTTLIVGDRVHVAQVQWFWSRLYDLLDADAHHTGYNLLSLINQQSWPATQTHRFICRRRCPLESEENDWFISITRSIKSTKRYWRTGSNTVKKTEKIGLLDRWQIRSRRKESTHFFQEREISRIGTRIRESICVSSFWKLCFVVLNGISKVLFNVDTFLKCEMKGNFVTRLLFQLCHPLPLSSTSRWALSIISHSKHFLWPNRFVKTALILSYNSSESSEAFFNSI